MAKKDEQVKEKVQVEIPRDVAEMIEKIKKENESFSDATERVFMSLVERLKALDTVKTEGDLSDIEKSIREKYMLAGNLVSLKSLEKALKEGLGIEGEGMLDDDKMFKRLERIIMLKAMMGMFGEQKRDDSEIKVALAKLEAQLELMKQGANRNEDKEDKTEAVIAYVDAKFNEILKRLNESKGSDGLDKLKEAKRTIEEYAKVMKELGVSGDEADKWKQEAVSKLIENIGKIGTDITDTIKKQQLPVPPSMQAPAPPVPPPQAQQLPAEVLAHLQNNIPFMLSTGEVVVPVSNKNVMNAIEQYVAQGVKQSISGYDVLVFGGDTGKKVLEIIQKL
jgi:predicted CopG family antitoxin/ribosomal protein L7/L12